MKDAASAAERWPKCPVVSPMCGLPCLRACGQHLHNFATEANSGFHPSFKIWGHRGFRGSVLRLRVSILGMRHGWLWQQWSVQDTRSLYKYCFIQVRPSGCKIESISAEVSRHDDRFCQAVVCGVTFASSSSHVKPQILRFSTCNLGWLYWQ